MKKVAFSFKVCGCGLYWEGSVVWKLWYFTWNIDILLISVKSTNKFIYMTNDRKMTRISIQLFILCNASRFLRDMHHQQSVHQRQGTPRDTTRPSKDNTETKYFTHLLIQILEVNDEREYFRTGDVNAKKPTCGLSWQLLFSIFQSQSFHFPFSFYIG